MCLKYEHRISIHVQPVQIGYFVPNGRTTLLPADVCDLTFDTTHCNLLVDTVVIVVAVTFAVSMSSALIFL